MRKTKSIKILAVVLVAMMLLINLNVFAAQTDAQIKAGFYKEVEKIMDENLNKEKLAEYKANYEFDTNSGKVKINYAGDPTLTYKQFNGTGSVVGILKILEDNADRNYVVESIMVNGNEFSREVLKAQGDQMVKIMIASELANQLAPGKNVQTLPIKDILSKPAILKMKISSKAEPNRIVNANVSYIINDATNPVKDEEKIKYELKEEPKTAWNKVDKSGNKEMVFVSNAPFNKFLEVKLDGETLDPENYTAEEGSTKITLKKSFLSSLLDGTYKLTIVSEDGEVSGNFKIASAQPAIPAEPKNPEIVGEKTKPSKPEKVEKEKAKEEEKTSKTPKTGSEIILASLVFGLAVTATGIVLYKKSKNK